MHTVNTLLDAAKKRAGITSDYRLARLVKLTDNTISNYRNGRSLPNGKSLMRLSTMAGITDAEMHRYAQDFSSARLGISHPAP
jgi:transcriptional regulator with XRE-family HTH domain